MAQFFGPGGGPSTYQRPGMQQQRVNPNAGFFDTYGKDIMEGGLAALGGGMGAYSLYKGMPQTNDQFLTDTARKMMNVSHKPIEFSEAKPQQEEKESGMSSFNQIQDLLAHLTSQKADKMMGPQQPSQPMELYQNAFQTANQQTGSPQVPEWSGSSQGLSFLENLGGGAQNSSLIGGMSPEDMVAQGSAQNAENNKSWWRKGLNIAGQGLQAAAPIGGMLGPLGWLGGAAAGLGGHLLQKL